MSDDHDWVARLLAASGPVAMPEDVADRLSRALAGATDRAGIPQETDGRAPATTDDVVSPPEAPDTGTTSDHHGTGSDGPTIAAGAVPPVATGTVPPAASTSTTGALPRLRSVPTTGSRSGPARSGSDSSQRVGREEDQGEHRRHALVRWAPVAASVLVLGGAGFAVASLFGGGDGPSPTVAADSADSADSAAGAAQAQAAPSALLATGSQYTTTDRAVFDEQVRQLVALASDDSASAGGDASATGTAPSGEDIPLEAPEAATQESAPAAGGSADASAPAAPAQARAAAESSPLADPQALAECVEGVTKGTSATAAAVDLAVVDGLESTVLVVPDAAGLSYQVYVVGPDCGDIDTRFDFFTVTP